jgi:general L-amino acid transport system substrate-binding protein
MRTFGKWAALVAVLAALALVVAACGDDDDDGDDGNGDGASAGASLQSILDNGSFKCGTRDDIAGFAALDASGERAGFDTEYCRAIAAALFGDSEAVEFVDIQTADRFTALQSGEIDVLVRNTTWTATRDGSEGATFLATTFYDGQGMLVDADGPYQSLSDMDGTTICLTEGTTTQLNLEDGFKNAGVSVGEALPFADPELIQEAYNAGRCDGWTADRSALAGFKTNWPGGSDKVRILDETFSKEPLGPAVSDGSDDLAQAVDWAVFATIQAEEFGITSKNVDQIRESSEDPNVRRFLGLEEEGGTFDPGLGLPTDFNYQVVKQVGNYGEIFERNITPLGLDRGVNALWTDGGLIYAPPYR